MKLFSPLLRPKTIAPLLAVGMAGMGALAAPSARAADLEEPWSTGWSFYADNDLFVPGAGNDRDYTGGLSLTLAGRRSTEDLFSLHGLEQKISRSLLADKFPQHAQQRHAIEYGLTVMTPGKLTDTDAQKGDRPYANLLYVASTTARMDPAHDIAWLSTFTVGVFGVPAVAELQGVLHQALGSTQPRGWQNQISDGGELSFRYSLARTRLLADSKLANVRYQWTGAMRASVGYLTEATFGVAGRMGHFQSPWWSFNPQLADYAEKSVPVVSSGAERYLWGGVAVHARAYNVFLQGQFRSSAYTIRDADRRLLVAEAWVGYSQAWNSGWRLSYALRAQSSELRTTPGDHPVRWGEMVLSQTF